MSNDIVAQLKGLKLHGMASTWPELLAQSRHTDFEPERFMKQLLMAETAERQVRLGARGEQDADQFEPRGRQVTSALPEIGVVGLGAMGSRIAVRLMEGGYSVTGYDPRSEAIDLVAAKGAHVAKSPRDVADIAEIVIARSLPLPIATLTAA